jgi:hypothetical protein
VNSTDLAALSTANLPRSPVFRAAIVEIEWNSSPFCIWVDSTILAARTCRIRNWAGVAIFNIGGHSRGKKRLQGV